VFDLAEQRSEDELRELLVHFIYDIAYMQLMVKTQDRRVVISESVVAPSSFRKVLADVLYRHFAFGSVLFAPTSLFALFPLGSETGLVVDCGYSETQIMAVYNGNPLLGTFSAVGAGSMVVHKQIEDMLKATGQVPNEETIDEATLEDIKVRACVAVAPDSGVQAPTVDYRFPSGHVVQLDHALRTAPVEVLFASSEFDFEEFDSSIPQAILETLKQCPVDTRVELAKSIVLCGGTAMIPGFKGRLVAELLKLLEQPQYETLKGAETSRTKYTVTLSAAGGVRLDSVVVASDRNRVLDELMRKLGDCQITEATMEVDGGLVKVVLESPEDRDADNLKGGVQMSQRSYQTDTVVKETTPHFSGVGKSIAIYDPPFAANYLSWLGAAIFASLDCLADRSIDRNAYLKSPQLADWSSAATIEAITAPAKQERAQPSLRTTSVPIDRPRAWGLGSLAETKTPSLV